MEYIEPEGLCIDVAFDLEYEVDKVMWGEPDQKTIKFVGFYHYHGLPSYTTFGTVLLRLSKNSKGQYILADLKSLYILEDEEDEDEDEEYSYAHCKQWAEDGECENVVSVESLANEWIKKINKRPKKNSAINTAPRDVVSLRPLAER